MHLPLQPATLACSLSASVSTPATEGPQGSGSRLSRVIHTTEQLLRGLPVGTQACARLRLT